jgi:hypothetical protein
MFLKGQIEDYIIHEDEDMMNYILHFTPNDPNIIEPYLEIIIAKEADVKGLIIQKRGTISMLKTALKYIIENYSHIEYLTITDKTVPEITARRLLEGSKGWYEEHFHAKPSEKTKILIDRIKKNRAKIDELIENLEWNPKNIVGVCSKIDGAILSKNILKTVWIIDRETIKNY